MASVNGDEPAPRLISTTKLRPAPRRPRAASNLIRMMPYLRPYRWQWALQFAFAAAGVILTIIIPLITRAVIDGPVADRDTNGVWVLGLGALSLGAIQAVIFFVRRRLSASATQAAEYDIRMDMYARLQVLQMRFHDRWQSGQLLSRIMNDLGTIRRFLSFGATFLVLNLFEIVVITSILLFLYWPLGVVVALAIVPLSWATYYHEKLFIKLSRAAQDQSGVVATSVEESALGMRVVKSFGREEYVYDRFEEKAKKLWSIQLDQVKLLSRFFTILEVIPNLTLIMVMGLGVMAAGNGTITTGTLVAFIAMMMTLVWPIAAMGFLLSMAQETMTAADRVCELFDADVEILDGPHREVATAGRLQLVDVGFRYPDDPPGGTAPEGETRPDWVDGAGVDGTGVDSTGVDGDGAAASEAWALRHVNLTLEHGQTLALVGATGSGKSTLTALLPRLYDVSEGNIYIDGIDVREYSLVALRGSVATAFEDPTLFSLAVRENLTLGRPDATDAEVARVIEVAQAQFVYDLPHGLDTRIGEQGMSLSGGQRQRLSLARAVLAAPKILVLDDTMSALDVHTEALVERALRESLGAVTAIIVAHRASTVALADVVALLENGTITHTGTHAELLDTVPRYRELLAADDELDPDLEHEEVWEASR